MLVKGTKGWTQSYRFGLWARTTTIWVARSIVVAFLGSTTSLCIFNSRLCVLTIWESRGAFTVISLSSFGFIHVRLQGVYITRCPLYYNDIFRCRAILDQVQLELWVARFGMRNQEIRCDLRLASVKSIGRWLSKWQLQQLQTLHSPIRLATCATSLP